MEESSLHTRAQLTLTPYRVGGDIDAVHVLLDAAQILVFFANVVIEKMDQVLVTLIVPCGGHKPTMTIIEVNDAGYK